MRILIVNEGLYGAGGVETYLSALIPAMQEAGHQIGVLHDTPLSETGPQRIAPDGTWRAGVQDEGLETALARVQGFAPHVVFSHNMRSLEIESRLADRWPVVKMMHGHFGTCVSRLKSLRFPAASACTRTFGPGCLVHYLPRRCGHANPFEMMRQYRWGGDQRDLFPRYRSIVVASRYMRDEYLRAGAAPGAVRAIPLFAPLVSAPVQGPRSIDVLFVGRLTNLKGPDAVIDAAARAQRQLGRPLKVVVAGEGPELHYVRDLAAARGVNATFTGWIDPAARDRLLREAAMLVVPSRWPEPFGLVGLEAAAFGTPAVAFNSGGIRDWLIDDENGRLIDANDDAGMGDAIAEILGKPALHARLSKGALAAANRFTLEAHVTAISRVLQGATIAVAAS